ncbi:MAG: hypothetical protein DRG11_05090 [Epsilonproteobacteria bacterium]|nr:MAG: hypothetical protein DRG11_05090 [Campylobacterota bacterium]
MFGFINKNSKIVIPTIFSKVQRQGFDNMLVGAKFETKWGFLNKTGKCLEIKQ